MEAISRRNDYSTFKLTLTSDLKNVKFKCSNKYANYLEKHKSNIKSATLTKTKSGKYFLPIAVPEFVMKLVLGEMSSIILEGTRASNEKIKSTGFTFKYAKLEETFDNLLKK